MLDVEALSDMMAGIIAEEVEKAVAPLTARIAELEGREPVQGPPGERGADGAPGTPGEKGMDGRDGKDGAGIADLLRDHEGNLVATFTDGRLKNLGPIQGKDGRDGFGFDDLDACVLEDDRTVELSFRRGEEEKSFTFKWPTVIDRGVWKQGQVYNPGDAVTWAGSLWIAQKETTAKPDGGEDWRLAVKRGRDGKDAR